MGLEKLFSDSVIGGRQGVMGVVKQVLGEGM